MSDSISAVAKALDKKIETVRTDAEDVEGRVKELEKQLADAPPFKTLSKTLADFEKRLSALEKKK